MPEAMPAHFRYVCPLAGRVDNPPKQVVSTLRRFLPRWEKQIVRAELSGSLSMCQQGSQDDVSQWKFTHAATGFRWTKLSSVNTLAHLEDAPLKIDVAPPQRKQLSRPYPSESAQQNHRPRGFRQFQKKRAELLDCNHPAGPRKLLGRQPSPPDRIGSEVVPLHCCSKDTTDQVAEVLDGVLS